MEAVRKRSESMKALRVLVVEDDVLIGMLFADALAAMGYDVCAIEATEADAVAAAARYKPDLMIVDAVARWKRRRSGPGNTPHRMDPARVRQWRDFEDSRADAGRNCSRKAGS
jgi:CheY-like chemotaxis protein